jgi:hypothetical protein
MQKPDKDPPDSHALKKLELDEQTNIENHVRQNSSGIIIRLSRLPVCDTISLLRSTFLQLFKSCTPSSSDTTHT